ncbi:V-type ATP synthase subunit D [Streptococcus pseudoporcinus]|uniref:V-type ATP synthase subunit D n=1 Tax=Streptococcus pseudoporcinus TaxID=361101 RepID=A0A4U9XGW4_9STRE|nr:V-type ATP synthase subunit D [Streptococcus pseudoporcinus]VTS12374.1 V-type H+-transporting ATPase subunit D [Streptococcus pseudoporcinus]VUC64900.1 V-type H+-transporting ATPase subunit D [Streptococcus pseudoporcinus]VUC95401.1 V-type H+-transporting ATPase subunit D [Streptococcus pseudoporcinus]VUC95796.1 V-type H+-transporting ATPase subunit D [Streptococcus pseudoporcinus]
MSRLNVKPTRMELNSLKKRLRTAKRGHKLLKDKRDELMHHFVDLIRENDKLRRQVEACLIENMQTFVLAKSLENNAIVEELFSIPVHDLSLYIEVDNIMSVHVPKYHIQEEMDKGEANVSYSFLASNSEMDQTIQNMEKLLQPLLRLAEVEKQCQLMADDIEKTRRRVNGLEHAIIPQLIETIHYIELKLEEAERSHLVRIMKVNNPKTF